MRPRAWDWLLAGRAPRAPTTAGMAVSDGFWPWVLLRFAGGWASAFILIFTTTLVVSRLRQAGGVLPMLHFAGVGTGIAISALISAPLVAASDALHKKHTTASYAGRLLPGDVHAYASPRPLAVVIEKLATAQEDRKVSQKGPSTKVAFDDSGKALLPAIAFAKKCGVDVTDLGRTATNKGEWLSYELLEAGKTTAEIIPGLIEKALAALPIPRRMRWGAGDAEFVRPIHWLVLLHGKETIDAEIMGIKSGAASQGHRFHSAGEINIPEPAKYLQTLEKKGHVIADFEHRRELIEKGAAG